MSLPPPIPLEVAQEGLLSQVEPLGGESVAVDQAIGRFIAAQPLACRTQPAADLSAMDGYVVRADDPGGPWTIVGESAAGHPFAGELQQRQAIRISTGAMMPTGKCAVLLQENATRTGDQLSLNGEGDPTPRHIRRKGFDFSEGDPILQPGTRVGPAQLALLLASGQAKVDVHTQPRLAILDSGDELSADPTSCAPHQIPASNGAMLAAMAAPYAHSIQRLGPVPDTMAAMLEALGRAKDADVIVTSGGASVGDHDLVRPALEQWGATIDFWRVAIKPGKPLMVARKGPQWIIGLPGNPVSSYVTAFLFLLPLLRKLAGAGFDQVLPFAVQVRLSGNLPATGSRQEFVRGFHQDGEVRPLDQQDSSALLSLSRANALIDRKPSSPAIEAGRSVWIYPLENGGIA